MLTVETVSLDGAHGLTGALPGLAGALGGGLERRRRAADCVGLALGFCGLVDSDTGRVLSTNAKYDDAPRIDLPRWCRESLGLRLRVENDARLALLGERHAGAARGVDDVVMMTIGTGIGGVALIGGRLLRGPSLPGRGARRSPRGRLRPTLHVRRPRLRGGRSVHLGAAAGRRASPGFAASALAGATPRLRGALRMRTRGDRVAATVREHCLRVWSAGAVAMVHAWDPELLVLGGGVMRHAGAVLPAIDAHVRGHAWTPWGTVTVRAAALGERAALLGAVPLLCGA